MNRQSAIETLQTHDLIWDMVIVGGGATGLGIAIDAANRGYKTLLLERYDFGKGTSTRSTKLVHGGVRYLEQGNITLVRDALRERGVLLKNASHLAQPQPFMVPAFSLWQKFYYGIGLKMYDLLAGKNNIRPSSVLNRDAAIKTAPDVNQDDLAGGITYFDAQFDDARLIVNMAQTASEQGATVLNYMEVREIQKENGRISHIEAIDQETNQSHTIRTKTLVNATGPFSDALRTLADPDCSKMIQPSQGAHVVLHRSFYSSDTALMIPKTKDGRVLFAIPWHDVLIAGTTDTPVTSPSSEPVALDEEIDFIMEHLGMYLKTAPQRSDILSIFVGLRPLVRAKEGAKTSAISRDHTIEVSPSGLITIAGGKWTTYRKMAEDTVNKAAKVGELPIAKCATAQLKIHGHTTAKNEGAFHVYGTDAELIAQLINENPDLGQPMHPDLPICPAQVLWAVRNEMARSVEDVLSRRTRCLLINARASLEIAPQVASLIAPELNQNAEWEKQQTNAYTQLTQNYLPKNQ
jgi:glycerol-3-phosphate dehydrogenase